MVRKCYVPGCCSVDSTLFRLPPTLVGHELSTLLTKLNIVEGKHLLISFRICGDHFTLDSILHTAQGGGYKLSDFPKIKQLSVNGSFAAEPMTLQHSFDEADKLFPSEFLLHFVRRLHLEPWLTKPTRDGVFFFNLLFGEDCVSVDKSVFIKTSTRDVTAHVRLNGRLINEVKIKKWTQLDLLLEEIASNEIVESPETVIADCAKKLQSIVFDEVNDFLSVLLKLIICQLLNMCSKSKRYCPDTILMCMWVKNISTQGYSELRKFFNLPCERRLHQLNAKVESEDTWK